MDPVNKWLTVVILFMLGVLIVFWNKGSVNSYQMELMSNGDHTIVYVLDTADGDVFALAIDEDEDLFTAAGKPFSRPQEVFEVPSGMSTHRRY